MANISEYISGNIAEEIAEWKKDQSEVVGVFLTEPVLVDTEYEGKKAKKLEGVAELSTGKQGMMTLRGQRRMRVMKNNARQISDNWGSDTKAWVGKKFVIGLVKLQIGAKLVDCIWLSPLQTKVEVVR